MEQSTTAERPTDTSVPDNPAPVVAATSTPAPPTKKGTTFESLAIAGFVFGIFAMVVAVFAVGLAARAVSESSGGGAASGGGSAPATLDLTLADFSLDPDAAEISAGGTITLDNTGAVAHDLVVDGAQSDMIDPGTTGELVVDGVEPGEYTMYCSVPGHREAGMEGTITVK